MSYKLSWKVRGVIKHFSGHLTDKQLMQSVIDVEGDSRFDSLRYVINDFREVISVSVDNTVVEEIAAIDMSAAKTNPNIRIAIVATSPEIITASEQYAYSPFNAYPTRIFSSMEEANSWLGLKDS